MLPPELLLIEEPDRFATQDLINGWVRYADRRWPEKQAAFFTVDGVVAMYLGDPAKTQFVTTYRPVEAANSRDPLR